MLDRHLDRPYIEILNELDIERVRASLYPDAAGWKEPTTSKEAALKVCAKQLDAEVLFHIKKYCFGCSPENLVEDFGLDLLSARPAFSRLKARGLIVDSGRRSKTANGNNCKVWIPA